jgi:hypothetical protein
MTGQHVLDRGGGVDREAKWQKHVVVALWVCLAVFALLCITLLYAKTHGWFHATPAGVAAPWPASWP